VVRPDLDPTTVADAGRRYHSRITRQRLHRGGCAGLGVLSAYGGRCKVCRLRPCALLDAHTRPDYQGGQPVVPNGQSLCRIHHSAFDHCILGRRVLIPRRRLEAMLDQDREVA
jgi:putative restriction endonuclease